MKTSSMLIAAILGMSPIQKELYGTRQKSLLDIPPKPETETYYRDRAEAKRKRRAEKRAVNILKAKGAQ